MSINLQKRITTGPTTVFVSCTQLPIREDIIFRQDMVSYKGGGGGRGGGSRSSSSNAGRVAQVGGTYDPDDGGVTRRTQQLMEGSVLSNSGGGQTGLFRTRDEIRENSLYGRIGNAITSGADALGDAASECWDSATDYAGQLCSLSTWRGLAGPP